MIFVKVANRTPACVGPLRIYRSNLERAPWHTTSLLANKYPNRFWGRFSLLQLLQVGDNNLVPLRQRLPLSQPKLNHPALQKTLLSQNLQTCQIQHQTVAIHAAPLRQRKRRCQATWKHFWAPVSVAPWDSVFLLCRGPRASAAALTAICCSLTCLANRIKSSF